MCVHNGRSNTSAAAELAELGNNILRKNTIFNEHPVANLARIMGHLVLSSYLKGVLAANRILTQSRHPRDAEKAKEELILKVEITWEVTELTELTDGRTNHEFE